MDIKLNCNKFPGKVNVFWKIFFIISAYLRFSTSYPYICLFFSGLYRYRIIIPLRTGKNQAQIHDKNLRLVFLFVFDKQSLSYFRDIPALLKERQAVGNEDKGHQADT